MPYKPKRPCYHSGCPALTDHPRGYCPEHLPQRYQEEDSRRGTSTERGYTYQWHKASRLFLKANPLCVECLKQGITTAATVVDHIKPHRGDMVLFWDESNWQPLCKQHHDIKTAQEDGAFGRGGGGQKATT